jgi:hypothetical protein
MTRRDEKDEEQEPGRLPKSEWGEGPWQSEPDRFEWRHECGYPLLAVRGPHGAWCGYVGLPPGHPWHGQGPWDLGVEAHGGLTYASPCDGEICHVAGPGEPDDVWWLGFDCSHAFDLAPETEAVLRKVSPTFRGSFGGHYWTLDEVKEEVRSLGDQLFAAASLPHGDEDP